MNYFDYVICLFAAVGFTWLIRVAISCLKNNSNRSKIEESDFERATRLLMEAQDEYQKLIVGDFYRNREKIKGNQAYQNILIQELEKAGRQMQESAYAHELPDDINDFSFWLKKKARCYLVIKTKWFNCPIYRYQVAFRYRYVILFYKCRWNIEIWIHGLKNQITFLLQLKNCATNR
jgi:hypothetical protein